MLDISTEIEASVQFHADKSSGPGSEGPCGVERVLRAGQFARKAEYGRTRGGPKLRPRNRGARSGGHDQLKGGGMLMAEGSEPARELQEVWSRIEAVGEVGQACLGHKLDQFVAAVHSLIQGGGSNSDTMRHGLHRETPETVLFEKIARGEHNGLEGSLVWCRHSNSIAIDSSHGGYVL